MTDEPWKDDDIDYDDPFDPKSILMNMNEPVQGDLLTGASTVVPMVPKTKTSSTHIPRCYESHPPYKITDDLTIYGGSCSWPMITDADVYGGFDYGMHPKAGVYPWSQTSGPVEFLFEIVDRGIPKNEAEFDKMIVWLGDQLKAGKKVHIGCIGGHGRTGMVLAALRHHLTGDVDATAHVRENYCKKAVESQKQVDFLNKRYGINKVPVKTEWLTGTKTGKKSASSYSSSSSYSDWKTGGHSQSTGNPLNTAASIWGDE
jgi:hypothetical protein